RLDNDAISLYENWVWANGGLILKDTKDHQMRRVSIDKVTADLLRRHKSDCTAKLLKPGCARPCRGDLVERGVAAPPGTKPLRPGRKRRLVVRLKQQAHPPADQLVRPGRQAKRPQGPVPLGNMPPPNRGEPIVLGPQPADDLPD